MLLSGRTFLGSGELILPEDLPEVLLESKSQSGLSNRSYCDTVQELKRQVILNAVDPGITGGGQNA